MQGKFYLLIISYAALNFLKNSINVYQSHMKPTWTKTTFLRTWHTCFQLCFFSFLYCWHSFVIDTQITWEKHLNHSSWVFHHHKITQSAWFELSCKCIPRELEKQSWSKQVYHKFIKFLHQKPTKWLQNEPKTNMTNEYGRVHVMTQEKLQKIHNSIAFQTCALIWKTGSIALKREAFGLAPGKCGQPGVVSSLIRQWGASFL